MSFARNKLSVGHVQHLQTIAGKHVFLPSKVYWTCKVLPLSMVILLIFQITASLLLAIQLPHDIVSLRICILFQRSMSSRINSFASTTTLLFAPAKYIIKCLSSGICSPRLPEAQILQAN